MKSIVLKKICAVVLTASLCSAASAKAAEDSLLMANLSIIDKQEIPADTTVETGVLENGLTYYVRHCDSPKEHVNFNLLVRGGSVIEEENERGIAHFVEHMLFRGTKHFPKQKDVIGFMNRNGVRFGNDANASTSYTTVEYHLNDVPTDDKARTDSCFLLLRDWASEATITDEDVENERNIIIEERRLSNATIEYDQFTINLRENIDLWENSIYAERAPIGDMEIIRECPPQVIRDFYKRWYQPQNMAVVVTGDIDKDEMVEKIRKTFGDMKRGTNSVPEYPKVPEFDTPKVRFYGNKPSTTSSVIIMRLPEPTEKSNTIGALRSKLTINKIEELMRNRLKALKGGDILEASVYVLAPTNGPIARFISFELTANADNWKQTLETLAKQIEYARRTGFKEYEQEQHATDGIAYNTDSTAIDFASTTYTSSAEISKIWTEKISKSFYNRNVINDYNDEGISEQHIRNTLTREQIDETFRSMADGRNMTIVNFFPEDFSRPKESEVREIINRVRNMTDDELAETLIERGKKLEVLDIDSININPIPGTVKKLTVLNDSISEVMLSNGVKVVLWKDTCETPFCARMAFGRPLGYSALSDEDMHYHDMLSSCRRKFQEPFCSEFTVNPSEDIFEFICNNSYGGRKYFWKDIEKRLKVLYATLTTTEVDSVEAKERIANTQGWVLSSNNPYTQAVNKMITLPVMSAKRLVPPTIEEARKFNVNHLRELTKDYFSNFNGSVLVVKGDINTDTIMPLILKYVGSLPSKREPVKRIIRESDHFRTTDTTVTEKIEYATPYCATYMYYTWEKGFKYTQETHAHNKVMQNILENMLIEKLRTQHGDIYSIRCDINDLKQPVSHMLCTITFTCNPTQRERIAKDADRLIRDMAENDLITQEFIDGYAKSIEKEKVFWDAGRYVTHELNGTVYEQDDTQHVRKVTPASLKAHLKKLLKKGNLHIGYLTTE